MRKISVLLITLFSIVTFAQKKQNIIISSKFDFQAEKNEYNINNMLKAILTSNNFQVYFDDEVLPLEIAQNRCNALVGNLIDNSNMFSTKVKLQIKDCQNNLLFETDEVKSKEKDVQIGFIEAIKLLSPEIKKYKATLIQKKEAVQASSEITTNSNVTYKLVEINNGFAIMNANSKVVLHIYKTTNPNVFIADKFSVKGVFTKLENKGVFEYYFNDKLVVEEFLF